MYKIEPSPGFNPEALTFDPAGGFCFQGDLVLIPMPDGFKIDKSKPVPCDADGTVPLLEGEGAGHVHRIAGIGIPQPTSFHDEAMAHSLMVGTKAAAPATLYSDPDAVSRLIGDGILETDELAIGFLEVTSPVALRHEEHQTIIIKKGLLYVGRQREFREGKSFFVED